MFKKVKFDIQQPPNFDESGMQSLNDAARQAVVGQPTQQQILVTKVRQVIDRRDVLEATARGNLTALAN